MSAENLSQSYSSIVSMATMTIAPSLIIACWLQYDSYRVYMVTYSHPPPHHSMPPAEYIYMVVLC